jgi:hypothetical protein
MTPTIFADNTGWESGLVAVEEGTVCGIGEWRK